MNVYELLNRFTGRDVYVRPIGHLKVTAPRTFAPQREVRSNFDRGGFQRGACTVPLDSKISRGRLTVRSMRDHNVRDHHSDSYGYTSYVVGEFEGDRFVKVNDKFEARLNRELYEALRACNACRETDNLNSMVMVDISHLPLFPVMLPDMQYINDKINLLSAEARFNKLYYFKTHARKYFKKHGITFDGLDPMSERGESSGLYRIVESYSKVTFQLEGTVIVPSIQEELYRTKVGRSFQYNEQGYNLLVGHLESAKSVIDSLKESVRLRELSYAEHLEAVLTVTDPETGHVYTITRVVEEAEETHYSILLTDAIRYVESNPTARIYDADRAQVTLAQARQIHADAVAATTSPERIAEVFGS